jgi:regulator of sigma E protease
MSFLLYAAGIAFAFGLVIFVHEFGHFMVAKKSGVKVDRFSFGLGPEMFGFQWGETRYCIAWLPLGGEVRMAGEMVEGDEPAPKDPNADHSRDFFFQPWYRRLAIALAGPFMNYVLAFVIFFGMLLLWGEPTQMNKTEIGEVVAGMPAEKAGLQKGDRVLKVQNEPVEDFPQVAMKIHARPELATEILFDRAGQQKTVTVVPRKEPDGAKGLIGIRPADPVVERSDISFFPAAKKAGWQCWNITAFTLYYLGQKISARERPDVAGPLGISQVIVKAVKSGAEDFFYLIGLISVAIGLFNLFPVPMLDGGHMLYYVIEGVRGKPLSHKVMAKANMVGLALLLSLLVFATMNDIQRFRTSKAAEESPVAASPSPAEK